MRRRDLHDTIRHLAIASIDLREHQKRLLDIHGQPRHEVAGWQYGDLQALIIADALTAGALRVLKDVRGDRLQLDATKRATLRTWWAEAFREYHGSYPGEEPEDEIRQDGTRREVG